MGRRVNPLSGNQISLRAKRLADPEHGWRQRLLVSLALGILRAHHLRMACEQGEAVSADPFPMLPSTPGAKVKAAPKQQALVPADLGEWLVIDGRVVQMIPPDQHPVFLQAQALAEQLEPKLVNELHGRFFTAAAEWIGQRIADGPQQQFSVLSKHPPDMWAVPPQPLGLPGGVFELDDPALVEGLAENAACWWAARQLYRSMIDGRPDSLGRRGLERPHQLRALLVDLGLLEPDGEQVGALESLTDGAPVTRCATGMPVRVASKALLRADLWESDEIGGRYVHQHARDVNNKAEYEMRLIEKGFADRLPEGALFFGLDQCQSILKTRGLDAAALHGVLCCYLAMLPDPTATIELDGRELLADMGLHADSGSAGYSISDQLKRLGHSATVLMSLLFSSNGTQRDGSGWLTTSAGALWNIGIRTDGYRRQMELDGIGLNPSVRDAQIDGLTLTVSGGTWLKSHLNRDSHHGGEGRYQFGPVALSVLRLGRYRQELAFRIGMHLSLGFRIWKSSWKDGHCTKSVESILRECLPDAVIDKALAHKQSGHLLREQWMAALATLHQCCGFRFEFPEAKYPVALIPESLRTPAQQAAAPAMPHGATDKLLKSFLVVHWPEDVQALRQGAALKAVEERPKLPAPPRRSTLLPEPVKPNAARLAKVLAKAKADGVYQNQRELAGMLQISQGQISKLANGRKELTDRELVRIERLLGVRVHQRGDGYLKVV